VNVVSTETEQPVVEEQPSQVEQPTTEQATTAQPAETPAVERDIEADTLEIPDSGAEGGKARYVPASALAGARSELKELKSQLAAAKEGSARAQQLEQQVSEYYTYLQQIQPKVQAYDAAMMAPPQQAHESPEDRAELEEIARDFDFYKTDGALDLDKARRQQTREARRAETIAQRQVAPLAQHTLSQQSQTMLARAKATKAPNGQAPDPGVLDAVWARLDPSLTATVDGAKQAWAVALGYSAATATQQAAPTTRNQQGQFTKKEDIGEPMFTEKAGGRDMPEHISLSDKEKQFLKDVGMSEKEYLESANSAPWLKRGR